MKQEKTNRILNSSLYNSIEKDEIKDFLLNCHPNPKRIFTLGGVFIKDGKLFQSRWGCSIRSVERNKEFYLRQRKEVENYSNIYITYDVASNFIQNQMEKETPFDIMFFDYQGIYDKHIEEDIDNIFKCTFEKDAVIAFTFCKGHDSDDRIKDTKCIEETCCGRIEKFRQVRALSISTTIISMARKYGYRLSNIKIKEYQNSPFKNKQKYKGSPMLFLAFKIKNV